jgi:hypothetical protein
MCNDHEGANFESAKVQNKIEKVGKNEFLPTLDHIHPANNIY